MPVEQSLRREKKNPLLFSAQVALSLSVGLIAAYFFTGRWNVIWVLLLAGTVLWCSDKILVSRERRAVVLSAVFGAAMAAAAVVGRKIQVETKDFLALRSSDFLFLLGLFVLFTVVLAVLLPLLVQWSEKIGVKRTFRFSPRKAGLLAFLVVFVCWLISFLVYYPGSLSIDSFYTLRQAMGITPLTDYHPVVYTLLIRLFVKLGMLVGGPTVGVAVFSLAQMFFCAFTVGYGTAWLCRRRPHPAVPVIAVLWFALSPMFADFSFTLWKDVPFAAAVLLYTLYTWDVVESRGEKLQSFKGAAGYVLVSFLMGIFRHNGYYVLILSTVVLLVCFRKKLRRTLPALLCGALLVPLVLNAFYACGVKKGPFSESLSIPVQQIARTVKLNGTITPEQQESLERLFDVEKLQGYDPFLADPAKNSLNREYLNAHKGEFFRLWFSLLPGNFGEYCRAYLMQTYGYWNWEPKTIPVGGIANAARELGVTKVNWLFQWTGVDLSGFLQQTMDFPSTGTIVWILLAGALLLLYRKNYRTLLAYLPAAGVWLTILVATPLYCSMRYVLALPYVLPFLLFLSLFGESGASSFKEEPSA